MTTKRPTSQTKNLVILYQKLFNLGHKKYKAQKSENSLSQQINIRKCSSLRSFKQLLIAYPQMQKIMVELLESGQLLLCLVKWRGQHANMAVALKYFNKLINIIFDPNNCPQVWNNEIKISSNLERQKQLQLVNVETQTIDNKSKSIQASTKFNSTTQMLLDNFNTDIFFENQNISTYTLEQWEVSSLVYQSSFDMLLGTFEEDQNLHFLKNCF